MLEQVCLQSGRRPRRLSTLARWWASALVASLCAGAARTAAPPERLQRDRDLRDACAGAPPPPRGIVVVSAANSRYADKELTVLVAVRRRLREECFDDASAALVSYDIGLRGCFDDNRAVFAAQGVELRQFNFSRHPRHVAKLGCYAWKAPIVHETAERFPDRVVVWLDSGLEFNGKRSFREVIAHTVAARGFLSDWTQKTIESLTHEGMLGYFEDHFGLRREAALRRHAANGSEVYNNCNGAFSAHLKGSERYETITKPWVKCSLTMECVCPKGSGRHNHRQDQAALTLLAIREDVRCGGWGHERWVATHGQRNWRELLQDLQRTLPKVRPSATCPATEPGVTYPVTEKDLLPKRR